MRRPLTRIAAASILVAFMAACTKDKGSLMVPASPDKVTYTNTIQAIMNSKCLNCHGHGYATDYSSYQKLMVIVNDGKLRNRVLDLKDMPMGEVLSTKQLSDIQRWMELGAPE